MAPFILVAPSSRGIGHALTSLLLRKTSYPVLATTHSTPPSSVRESLLSSTPDASSRLTVRELDVTSPQSVSDLATFARSHYGSDKTDALLRAAFFLPGILLTPPERSPADIDYDVALQTFKTNTIGPMLLLKEFVPFLPKKSAAPWDEDGDGGGPLPEGTSPVAVLAARVGSTGDNKLGGWYSYRASKAGVINVVKGVDIAVKAKCGDRAGVIAYHPGTVKTGLSKPFWGGVKEGKLFGPEQAAEYLLETVRRRAGDGRGRCWDWKGEEVVP